jgi:hypothetical protein
MELERSDDEFDDMETVELESDFLPAHCTLPPRPPRTAIAHHATPPRSVRHRFGFGDVCTRR